MRSRIPAPRFRWRYIAATVHASESELRERSSDRRHGMPWLRLLPKFSLALLLVLMMAAAPSVYAQEQGGDQSQSMPGGNNQNGAGNGSGQIRIPEPVTASLMAAPPYGIAPLTVGFFVIANDPENVGFLSYQWNFGDGAVSSLPPELYIFHVYKQPGNYVVSLVMKTVDGRSITLFTSIIVRPPS
ncbi:MAG: PKD domain-containing protein, partial [Candidatus Binataceae bacterium]